MLKSRALLTIAFSVLLVFCNNIIANPANDNAQTILVVGDSISAGYGIDVKQGWVQLLQNTLDQSAAYDYQVINGSVSGNTTGDGLGRLPALLKTHRPDIVIIELGGNDGLRGYPLKIMKQNLQKMIDLSRGANARILLAGIEIPPNYGQRYTTLFRQTFSDIAADNQDIAFLPFVLQDVAVYPNLMQADGIHPTADAQPILLKNIWPHLEPLLKQAE